MSDDTCFILGHYPTELKHDRAQLLDDLLRFTLQGVQVEDGEKGAALAARLQASLKARLYDRMTQNVPTVRANENAGGDTATLLGKALRSAAFICGVDTINVPLAVVEQGLNLTEQVGLKTQALESPAADYDTSALGAYSCAKDNLLVCESQLVCLHALPGLLSTGFAQGYGGAEQFDGCHELRLELYHRRERVLLDVLLFGALTGLAAEAVAIATGRLLYREGELNFSIMQYLQRNRRFPGTWLTASEDSFRADIVRRYKALASPEASGDTRPGRVKAP